MATKNTGWLCTHTAAITAQDETTATITVTAYWKNNGWTYDINNVSAWVYCNGVAKQVKSSGSIDATSSTSQSVSCGSATFTINKTTAAQGIACYAKITSSSSYVSGTKSSTSAKVSVPAKTSYTVEYNANGGSGAPASQTKWHGVALTISSTKPTRTGYTFKGWSLTEGGAVYYTPGSTCGKNEDLELYAIWAANTYTISYDANGGTGAPGNQTKTYGVSLTLSSVKPTRTNYNFKGWSTSASSNSAIYAAGGKYTANAAATLYAVWELAYTKPRITSLDVFRCDAEGIADEEGTFARVAFGWKCDKEVNSISVKWKPFTGTTWTEPVTIPASGTSGGVYETIGSTSEFDIEQSYTIVVTVEDVNGSTSASQSLGETSDPLEFLADNKGIYCPKAVQGNVVGLSELILIPGGTNFDDLTRTGGYAVLTNADAETMTNIPIPKAGRLFVANGTGGDNANSEYRYLIHTFIPYLTSYPTYERQIRTNATSTWICGEWQVKSYMTKNIDFTPASGVTVNRCMIARNNDVVTMFMHLSYSSAITAGTNLSIGQIASDFPAYSVSTAGVSKNSLITAWVRPGDYTVPGEVLIRPAAAYTAGNDIEFNLSWNVNALWVGEKVTT